MTAIAILINNIRYSQWNPLEEGLLTSFVLASERSLACRLLSLLTAVVELELSAVIAWRLMPLTFTFVALLRGSDLLVWFLSTQGS